MVEQRRNKYGEVVYQAEEAPSPRSRATSFGGPGLTAIQIADAYVARTMGEMGLSQSRLESDATSLASPARADDPVLVVTEQKNFGTSSLVVYDQMTTGLQVFNARMGVHVDMALSEVTSLQSSVHNEVKIANPEARSKAEADRKVSAATLKKLGLSVLKEIENAVIARQVIYRYEIDEREDHDHDDHGAALTPRSPVVLPPVPDTIVEGGHYIVDELIFTASRNGIEAPVYWRVLVEPKTDAILYIRALVAEATGLVYARDPQTQTGAAVTGASSNAALNVFRTSETLAGLAASTPQGLSGEFVRVVDFDLPNAPPPVVPMPAGAFNYDVRTDNFSAVNAYFNCDRLFRTMQNYGFDVASYFDGTTFPVPIDHRARVSSADGNEVNAQAPGLPTGGLKELRFALLQAGQPVGIATDNRVVWHEFGHALLWDHVGSPNFGFAHSAGDSLAAILNDPGSQAADRFNTFPWVQAATDLGRRHDRAVSAGWAWFGPNYNTQYQGEQILATTLFRLYRSLGGDATTTIAAQRRAADTVAFLIFKAIGLLSSTTNIPEVYVTALQNSDLSTPDFKGIPGGAVHKVIRWAFEKQGLFQPNAAPGRGNIVDTVGRPPAVDVYIDDGRNGEYQYQPNHWSCQDMWVRRSADGGLTHQHPIVGQTNYMYVRVKSRGQQAANNVKVDAYHCIPGTGLAFPDDWQAMSTPSLPAAGPIVPGGSTIVGPFAWVPTEVGHECLLAIAHADGDPGNDTTINGTIPEHRFVPFDNNIGQRNVSPVLPTLKDLIRFFREHLILVRNPLKTPAVCTIEVTFPRFMRKLGWEMRVISEGGPRFELGPRDSRKVVLSIEPGESFGTDAVKQAIAKGDAQIVVNSYLDGELSGGMTYPLSFGASGKDTKFDEAASPGDDGQYAQPASLSGHVAASSGLSTIGSIIEALRNADRDASSGVEGRKRIRTVRLEIDLDE